MKKIKEHAFKKDTYFLGKDAYGVAYWLEAASWDCSWYWGFGYVESYTRNMDPKNSSDITSHTYFNNIWLSQHDDGYRHCLTDFEGFETPLTSSEQWKLSELMKQFYILRKAADLYHRGGSHITTSQVDHKDEELAERINKVDIPKILEAVYELLTPKGDE